MVDPIKNTITLEGVVPRIETEINPRTCFWTMKLFVGPLQMPDENTEWDWGSARSQAEAQAALDAAVVTLMEEIHGPEG